MSTPLEEGARVTRRYRGHTLILETRIETGGAVTVVDFMPPRGRNSDIVGIVRHRRAGHGDPAHRRRAARGGSHDGR